MSRRKLLNKNIRVFYNQSPAENILPTLKSRKQEKRIKLIAANRTLATVDAHKKSEHTKDAKAKNQDRLTRGKLDKYKQVEAQIIQKLLQFERDVLFRHCQGKHSSLRAGKLFPDSSFSETQSLVVPLSLQNPADLYLFYKDGQDNNLIFSRKIKSLARQNSSRSKQSLRAEPRSISSEADARQALLGFRDGSATVPTVADKGAWLSGAQTITARARAVETQRAKSFNFRNAAVARKEHLLKQISCRGPQEQSNLAEVSRDLVKKHAVLFSIEQIQSILVSKRIERQKHSELRKQLLESRKICSLYGDLPNRQLKKGVKQSKQMPGNSSDNLFIVLESRLDVVLERCAFFRNIKSARQAVLHSGIEVNNKTTNKPGYQLRPGDVIKIKSRALHHRPKVATGLGSSAALRSDAAARSTPRPSPAGLNQPCMQSYLSVQSLLLDDRLHKAEAVSEQEQAVVRQSSIKRDQVMPREQLGLVTLPLTEANRNTLWLQTIENILLRMFARKRANALAWPQIAAASATSNAGPQLCSNPSAQIVNSLLCLIKQKTGQRVSTATRASRSDATESIALGTVWQFSISPIAIYSLLKLESILSIVGWKKRQKCLCSRSLTAIKHTNHLLNQTGQMEGFLEMINTLLATKSLLINLGLGSSQITAAGERQQAHRQLCLSPTGKLSKAQPVALANTIKAERKAICSSLQQNKASALSNASFEKVYLYWLQVKKRLISETRKQVPRASHQRSWSDATQLGTFLPKHIHSSEQLLERNQNAYLEQNKSKALHIESSYKSFHAIFLYPPQRVYLNAVVDVDSIIKRF